MKKIAMGLLVVVMSCSIATATNILTINSAQATGPSKVKEETQDPNYIAESGGDDQIQQYETEEGRYKAIDRAVTQLKKINLSTEEAEQLVEALIEAVESKKSMQQSEDKDKDEDEEEVKAEVKDKGEEKDEGYYKIGLLIGLVVNLLLTIISFILFRSSISKIVRDKKTKKNKESNEEVEEIEKRVAEQEKIIENLIQEIKSLQKDEPLRGNEADKRNTAVSSSLMPKTYLRDNTNVTTIKNNLRGNTDVVTSKNNVTAQGDSRNRGIIFAYNEMMKEVARATAWDSKTIRENFANKYKVIAFKCVNAEDRVNRPELPPKFEISSLLESKQWGVPLSDNTLAVFPNPSLRDYESSTHYQGGMKELFESNYTTGNYRKIEVIQPAIVTRDFQIIKQGILRLSAQ